MYGSRTSEAGCVNLDATSVATPAEPLLRSIAAKPLQDG